MWCGRVVLVLLAVVVCDAQRMYWFKATESWQHSRGHDLFSEEEYSMVGSMQTAQTTTHLGCIRCDSNGDCTSNGEWGASGTIFTTGSLQLTIYFDAWEDDTGSRCTHDSSWHGHDDNRVEKTCTIDMGNHAHDTVISYQCHGADAALTVQFRWWDASTSAPPTPAPPTRAPPTSSPPTPAPPTSAPPTLPPPTPSPPTPSPPTPAPPTSAPLTPSPPTSSPPTPAPLSAPDRLSVHVNTSHRLRDVALFVTALVLGMVAVAAFCLYRRRRKAHVTAGHAHRPNPLAEIDSEEEMQVPSAPPALSVSSASVQDMLEEQPLDSNVSCAGAGQDCCAAPLPPSDTDLQCVALTSTCSPSGEGQYTEVQE